MYADEFQYDVFISYSHTDKLWVRRLAERLSRRKYKEATFRLFFDEWTIRVGESVPTVVRSAIRYSRHIILVISPEWIKSDWTLLEADSAIMLDPGAHQRRIIPILLKDCEIPYDIARLKYIDFRNQTTFEENLEGLVTELRGVISSNKLAKIQAKQRQVVLNLPILPWTPEGSPSLDFIWPELYVEPQVKPHKHPEPTTRLNQWLTKYNWKSNLAIVGPPGIGKSTVLRTVFLKLTTPEHGLPSVQRFPLLTTASEIMEFDRSHYKSLMSYLGSKLGIRITETIISKGVLLLVDGLDEVAEANIPLILDVLQDVPNDTVLWLGCRKEFFFQNIATKLIWNSSFYDFLELLEWDEKTDALAFIFKYAERTKQPLLYDRLLALRHDFPEIVPFLKNPFELTLLLYLLSEEKPLDRQNFSNAYALYSAFYENWLVREQHRGTAQLSPEIVSNIHHHIASILYSSKGLSIELQEVINDFNDQPSLDSLIKDTSFLGLLTTRVVPKTPRVQIIRFWHETIGEFLVADEVISAFKTGGAILSKVLTTVYNYEVNAFVRGAFIGMSNYERIKVIGNLESLYTDIFLADHDKRKEVVQAIKPATCARVINLNDINQSEHAIRIREQILYYIGRLPSSSFPEILRFAYYNESGSLLNRIAAISAMLHGDETIESDYLNKLNPGSPEDLENRSVQLIYFGDVDGDIYSYQDNGKCQWIRTRSAIYQRLSFSSPREMLLRWWDLRTLYLFYASRDWSDTVSTEDLETLSRAVVNSVKFSDEKMQSLILEKSKLLERLKLVNHGGINNDRSSIFSASDS